VTASSGWHLQVGETDAEHPDSRLSQTVVIHYCQEI
jgi:hypothetical protein